MSINLVQQGSQANFYDAASASADFSAPPTAGNTVIVAVTLYTYTVAVSVTVDGVAATLDTTTAGVTDLVVTRIYRASNVPGLTPDVDVTFSPNAWGAVRALEFSGLVDAGPVFSDSVPGEDVVYPDLDDVGYLAVTGTWNTADGGPTYWPARTPSDYTLSLNLSTYGDSTSGASAYRILPSASGATVTWVDGAGVVIAIYAAVPGAATGNTFFGWSTS